MKAGDPVGFQQKVNQGIEARKTYETTNEVISIPAAALTGDAAMSDPNLVDYYGNRAKVPNYTNSFTVMSREHFLPFNVQSAANKLMIPVAMVHSKNALSPDSAEKFYDNIVTEKESL